MIDDVVETAVGADIAISVNSGTIRGRNASSVAADAQEPAENLSPREMRLVRAGLDPWKVKVFHRIFFVISALVMGCILLVAVLAGLVGGG